MKTSKNLKTQQSGFTLVEAMIVIAILAILSVLAINYYEEQQQRGYRSDAINALQNIAQLQERYRTINGVFGTMAQIGGSSTSSENKYNITMTVPNTNDAYTITAQATGSQLGDDQCQVFSLTHTGIRSSKDKDDNEDTGSNSRCWPG